MKKIIAYVVVIIVAVGVYLSIWAGGKAEEIFGPTLITRNNNGETWVVHHNELNILGGNGEFKRAIAQCDLGVSVAFADMAVTKKGETIIGDVDSREIRRYSEDGSLIRVIKVEDGEKGTYQGTFKFAYDEEGRRLFVTDSCNHKVKIFDESGRYISSFGQKGDGSSDLHFPNRIFIGPDGLLYIADTNNYRISIWNKDGENIGVIKTSDQDVPKMEGFLSKSEMEILKGSVWPTFFDILPFGEMVAINKGLELRFGEVVIVDKGGVIKKLPLPPDSDPINVLIRADDILVSDNENMRVLRFSLDGKPLDDFGDSTFKEKLERSKALRDGFRKIKKTSQSALFLLLPGLLIALFMERRKTQTMASDSENDLAEKSDLIPIPAINISPGKKKIYIVSLVFWLIICPLFLAASIFFMPALRHHIPLPTSLPLIIIVTELAIMGASIYLVLKLSKAGVFREWQLKSFEKRFKMQAATLLSILRSDEKVRFFTFSIGSRNVKIPHLLILTTHRTLILKTDLTGRQIKRIRGMCYQSINKIDSSPLAKTKIEALLAKSSGASFISIHLQGIEEALQFRLPWAELADIIRDEISARKSLSGVTFSGIMDICTKCFSPIPAGENQCLKCGLEKVSPVQAALWSLLYPGLGQLKNNSLLKGSMFMIMATGILFYFILFLYTLHRGNAEVYLYDLTQIVLYTLILWASSAADAYLSAKQ